MWSFCQAWILEAHAARCLDKKRNTVYYWRKSRSA